MIWQFVGLHDVWKKNIDVVCVLFLLYYLPNRVFRLVVFLVHVLVNQDVFISREFSMFSNNVWGLFIFKIMWHFKCTQNSIQLKVAYDGNWLIQN